MGDSGLLQELPDIPPLLPQGGRDREQATAADGTPRRLDAMTDLELNHRLSQRSLSGVVGGFDAVDFQDCPKGFSARSINCRQVRTVWARCVLSPRWQSRSMGLPRFSGQVLGHHVGASCFLMVWPVSGL
jgi:hypothetical protein